MNYPQFETDTANLTDSQLCTCVHVYVLDYKLYPGQPCNCLWFNIISHPPYDHACTLLTAPHIHVNSLTITLVLVTVRLSYGWHAWILTAIAMALNLYTILKVILKAMIKFYEE